jgi:hypothetical protein
MDEFRITTYTGKSAQPFLGEIARLRIAVFREFPYLYDGTLEYEMDYLEEYVSSERSLTVLAEYGDDIVGASTGIPLADADEDYIFWQKRGYALQESIIARYSWKQVGETREDLHELVFWLRELS